MFFKVVGERDSHEKALHGYHHVPIPDEIPDYTKRLSHMGKSQLGKRFDRPKREQWTKENVI